MSGDSSPGSDDRDQEFGREASASETNGERPSLEEELIGELFAHLEGSFRDRLESLDRARGEYGRLAEGLAKRAGEEAGEAYESGRRYVREHPVRSVCGAFAVGALVGWITRRGS